MDWKLGGLTILFSLSAGAASDWPEGAEQAVADSCMMEGIAGKETTAEEIRLVKAFCKCYAAQTAMGIPFAEAQRLARAGQAAAAEEDMSPAAQKLRARIEVACEKPIKALDAAIGKK